MDTLTTILRHPRPPQLDHLPSPWRRTVARETCRALLPEHGWLGVDDPRAVVGVQNGSHWTTRRDLVLEVGRNATPLVLAENAAYQGGPVPVREISRFRYFGHRLMVIPAGTPLKLIGASGWVDWGPWAPGTGTRLELTLPDARVVLLPTINHFVIGADEYGRERSDDSGITWSELACAAVIVPATHRYVGDDGALTTALARISAAANGALVLTPWI